MTNDSRVLSLVKISLRRPTAATTQNAFSLIALMRILVDMITGLSHYYDTRERETFSPLQLHANLSHYSKKLAVMEVWSLWSVETIRACVCVCVRWVGRRSLICYYWRFFFCTLLFVNGFQWAVNGFYRALAGSSLECNIWRPFSIFSLALTGK